MAMLTKAGRTSSRALGWGMPVPHRGERPDVFDTGRRQLVHCLGGQDGTLGLGSWVIWVELSPARPLVLPLERQRPDRVVKWNGVAPK